MKYKGLFRLLLEKIVTLKLKNCLKYTFFLQRTTKIEIIFNTHAEYLALLTASSFNCTLANLSLLNLFSHS